MDDIADATLENIVSLIRGGFYYGLITVANGHSVEYELRLRHIKKEKEKDE